MIRAFCCEPGCEVREVTVVLRTGPAGTRRRLRCPSCRRLFAFAVTVPDEDADHAAAVTVTEGLTLGCGAEERRDHAR